MNSLSTLLRNYRQRFLKSLHSDRYEVTAKINRSKKTIVMEPTTQQEIFKIIKEMKSGKAPGVDGITTAIGSPLCHPLAEAVNLALRQEKYQDILKTAIHCTRAPKKITRKITVQLHC